MIDSIKLDLLAVLTKSDAYISFSDSSKLKELSNHTIHDAGIYQDQDSLKLAIIVYALSKMMERGLTETAQFSELLKDAKSQLENGKEEDFSQTLGKLLDKIGHEDSKMGVYVEEVIRQAKVRKGGKLIEHGLSTNQVAHLLGVTSWELMHYVGKTHLDEDMPSLDVTSRIKFARSLFK
ncbi:MAG TPA: hypothetical protein VJB90_06250 [Candidatus Nanoarchaeia archaeon]|nr:hypothetical protein [Candidatus Nanoarchaeia archaeon]